jgi:hypothetical protein
MAKKYTSQFSNLRGATYRVDIYDTTYSGSSPVEIPMEPPGFVLTYDGSTGSRYDWVIGSSVTLHYIATENNHTLLLNDIAGSAEGRYTVRIEIQNGASWDPVWAGVILPEQIEIEDAAFPQPFQIAAADDLANLKEVDYNASPGTPYIGPQTYTLHIHQILSKLRHRPLLADPIAYIEEAWKSDQQSGTAYNRILLHNRALYDEQDDSTIKFRDAYTVLEEIVSLMGLRIFQKGGAYIAQSISRAQSYPNTIAYTTLADNATVAQTTPSRPNIQLGTDLKNLRGWRNSYLAPLRKVTREYNTENVWLIGGTPTYGGTSTGVGFGTGILDDTPENSPFDADTRLNPGDPVSMTLKLALVRNGLALSGNNRVMPYRLNCRIRIGNWYMNRTVTFSGTTTVPIVGASGATAQVAAYYYNEPTWSTDPNSRVHFVTPPQQMNIDWTSVTQFGLTMPPLPDTWAGQLIQWRFTADAITSAGAVSEFGPNAFNYNTDHVQQVGAFRIYAAQTYLVDSDSATYEVQNADNNGGRETLSMPDVHFGDNIGPGNTENLYVLNAANAAVVTESWSRIGETDLLEIHNLACREVLSGQTKTIRVQRGTIQDERTAPTTLALGMDTVLTYGGVRYLPFQLTLDAYAATYDGEWFQIQRDTAGHTVAPTSYGDPIDTLPDGHVIEALSEQVGSTGTTVAAHATKLGLITVSSAVNLNTLQSTTNTNATDIDALEATVARLSGTFTPKGEAGATVTRITYEDDKIDGMSIELTGTQTTMASGSGNTQLTISEASPGIFQLDLQDQLATPGTSPAIYATGNSAGNRVGINNTSPSATLDVTGSFRASGNATINGTVNGRTMSTDGTKLDGIQALAEVNQLAFSNVAVGASTIAANSKTATLTRVSGTNITLTANTTTRSVTIDSSGGGGGGGGDTDASELFMVFFEK